MNRLLFVPLVLVISLFGISISFADYKAGEKAYNNSDFVRALAEWKPLAEKGDAQAQLQLGNMYFSGVGYYKSKQRIPENKREALKWYKLAAKQGKAVAQTRLGYMYFYGEAVPIHYKSAFKWYKLAAEQGYSHAQYNLADMYEKGLYITRNNLIAHMWFNLSISTFDPSGNYDSTLDELAKKRSKQIENRFTSTELEKAQQLAIDCFENDFKNCDAPDAIATKPADKPSTQKSPSPSVIILDD